MQSECTWRSDIRVLLNSSNSERFILSLDYESTNGGTVQMNHSFKD